MPVDLETEFLGQKYENPFMNASGVHCMTSTELEEIANSKSGSYITKSATILKRTGNPEPRYASLPLGSINSMGLPNYGFEYYLKYMVERQVKNPDESPAFFSIAGTSIAENLEMLKNIEDSNFQGITELNLSCPNVPGKPQLGYDFELTKYFLSQIYHFFTKPLGVKLPPYFDFAHFDTMAEILNMFPLAYVNCVNSIGNGLYIDPNTESVIILPKDGFGGVGGEYIKPTALANVRAFYLRLKPEIRVVGTGGIKTGQDAFEHLLCGASILQVGTELQKEGISIFERLTKELSQIMLKKGYRNIEEFRGKLKNLTQ